MLTALESSTWRGSTGIDPGAPLLLCFFFAQFLSLIGSDCAGTENPHFSQTMREMGHPAKAEAQFPSAWVRVNPRRKRCSTASFLGFPRVSTRKAFRPQFLHKRGHFFCCEERGCDGKWLQRRRESFLSLPDDCGRACSSR